MSYIVTGGAGFIGSHIAEAMAGKHEVVIIDNFFSGKRENLSEFSDSVHVIRGVSLISRCSKMRSKKLTVFSIWQQSPLLHDQLMILLPPMKPTLRVH